MIKVIGISKHGQRRVIDCFQTQEEAEEFCEHWGYKFMDLAGNCWDLEIQ